MKREISIEYVMFDKDNSSRAFFVLFACVFLTLGLMVCLMSASYIGAVFVGALLVISILSTVGSMMSKRSRRLSKREFRDEQIDDLIG